MKTFCFKLYKSERNAKLHKQINAAGLTYNHCIALCKRYYKIFHTSLNPNRLKVHLTKLKKISKFHYLLEIGSQAVQDVAERIGRAYKLFFRNIARKIRSSPPGFKKVIKYKSFTLKQAGWKLDETTYTLTIKRDSLGDIYIYFVTDAKDFKVVERTGKNVGYDFGLKKFLTASDGADVISPLFFAQNAALIAKAAKNLSHKETGSNNRQRVRHTLAKLYKKSANQRHDFHFKLARRISLEYDTI